MNSVVGPKCTLYEALAPFQALGRGTEDLYLTTTESGRAETTDRMEELPVYGNLAVITSGFFGLNLACLRPNLEGILILDHSWRVQDFWGRLSLIMANESDRLSVIERVNALIIERAGIYFNEDNVPADEYCLRACKQIEWLRSEIEDNASWLSKNKWFERIHKIFNRNNVVFLRQNFGDFERMSLLGRGLFELGWKTDIVYTSNIGEWAHEEGWGDAYRKALSLFVNTSCHMIEAPFNLEQRVYTLHKYGEIPGPALLALAAVASEALDALVNSDK